MRCGGLLAANRVFDANWCLAMFPSLTSQCHSWVSTQNFGSSMAQSGSHCIPWHLPPHRHHTYPNNSHRRDYNMSFFPRLPVLMDDSVSRLSTPSVTYSSAAATHRRVSTISITTQTLSDNPTSSTPSAATGSQYHHVLAG